MPSALRVAFAKANCERAFSYVCHAEVLQYSGVSSFLEPRWWSVGAAKLEGEDLNYLGVQGLRIAGGQGIAIIAVCQANTQHCTAAMS